MRAIKKINNNFALCIDNNGVEMIAYGRGVGFGKFPCDISLDRIERTFYDVDSKYIKIISDVPNAIIEAGAEIAARAEMELGCELNPNLPFTLADHLKYAYERKQQGIVLNTPISYDIQYMYPKEYAIGLTTLDFLEKKIGEKLPPEESISIAMHLISAELTSGDMHTVMTQVRIISDIADLIEKKADIQIDMESYEYSRFTMHIRYLIQRLSDGKLVENQNDSMLKTIAEEHPRYYECALLVAEYFDRTWHWKCTDDEVLYILLHIYRLANLKE